MNTKLYNNITYFIQHQKSSIEVVEKLEQRRLKNYSQHYILKNNLLFKKSKNKYLWIIKDSEVETLLFILHSYPLGGYLRISKVVSKIREKYYWLQYFEDIK